MRSIRTSMFLAVLACTSSASPTVALALEPTVVVSERFDADPAWEGFRNRLLPESLPITRQDFGFRDSNHAGGKRRGEIGGRVQRSTTPAYYAKAIAPKSLNDHLSASGKFAVPRAGGSSGVMIGWFHESSRGWRTPNSLAFRIDGNRDKFWLFYEYGTRHWLTGGGGAFEGERYQTTKTPPVPADATVHAWALDYQPQALAGQGLLVFSVDDRRYELPLAAGHRADGATFNRFGIWNVQTQGDVAEVYLDDLVIDGREETFDEDPRWEEVGNHVEFAERVIRPRHDFGYSATKLAGGRPGEIGGIVFRDERPAYYAMPLGPLSLRDELRAEGLLSLVQAGSDSGVYLGWFDSATKRLNHTPEHSARQKNHLAVLLEGPSRVGHYFRPSYAAHDGNGLCPRGDEPQDGRTWPVIHPDGRSHRWRVHYRPAGMQGAARIEVMLDDTSRSLELAPEHVQAGATFDRFGLFNVQSGGHHVELYIDDVVVTRR